jgi:hypothetical protein
MKHFTNLKEFEEQLSESQLDSIMKLIETDGCSHDFQIKLVDLLYNIGIVWEISQALYASNFIMDANIDK